MDGAPLVKEAAAVKSSFRLVGVMLGRQPVY
jgi:hypothetical protein